MSIDGSFLTSRPLFEAFTTFHSHLLSALDKNAHAAEKSNRKHNHQPWLTKGIGLKLIRKKKDVSINNPSNNLKIILNAQNIVDTKHAIRKSREQPKVHASGITAKITIRERQQN